MARVEVSEEDVRELRRIRDKLDGLRFANGLQGINSHTSIVVGPPLFPAPVISGGIGKTGPIPVKLVNPTGSAGTNGPPPTAATYTYDIQTPDGATTIATGVSVWMNRQKGHVTAAQHGYAQQITTTVGGTPTWYIVAHDEVIDSGSAC